MDALPKAEVPETMGDVSHDTSESETDQLDAEASALTVRSTELNHDDLWALIKHCMAGQTLEMVRLIVDRTDKDRVDRIFTWLGVDLEVITRAEQERRLQLLEGFGYPDRPRSQSVWAANPPATIVTGPGQIV
jgi:hypothetical protein